MTLAMQLACIALVGVVIVGLSIVVKIHLRAQGLKAVERNFSENSEQRASRERQEKHDACRATWKVYDAALDTQRAALEAQGAPDPYMISLSTQDYQWYVHAAEIHMPWRYNNWETNHIEKAPTTVPTLAWGWQVVGLGHPTRAAAEATLARIIAPDTYHYIYDATGLSQGRIAEPPYEDDHDA